MRQFDRVQLTLRLRDAREKTVQRIADLFGVPSACVCNRLMKPKTVAAW